MPWLDTDQSTCKSVQRYVQDNKGRLYIEVLQYGVLIVSSRYTDMKKVVSYQWLGYFILFILADSRDVAYSLRSTQGPSQLLKQGDEILRKAIVEVYHATTSRPL